MIDFLIFYEIKNREFEGIVLLRNELVNRGYSVEYICFDEIYDYKKVKKYFNKVKYAIMPSLYHNQEVLEIVYRVAGKVEYIFNLRWEQVYTNDDDNNINNYFYPKGVAQKALHLCWGEHTKDKLLEAGISQNNAVLSGPIQMDLLRSEFIGYFKDKKKLYNEYGIDAERLTILFVSSFSQSSMDDDLFERYLLQFSESERRRFSEFRKIEIETKKIMIEWLNRLADELDVTIIYRPHPTEKILSGELHNDNIRIIRDENIKQWILCCDQIYMWYSTSAAEAYMAKVPFYVLRPVPIPYNQDIPIFDDIVFIKTYKAFRDSVHANTNVVELDKSTINKYYYVDDVPVYKKTIDIIQKTISNSELRFPWNEFDKKSFVFQRIRILRSLLVYFIRGLQAKLKKKSLEEMLCSKRMDVITVIEFTLMESKLYEITRKQQ